MNVLVIVGQGWTFDPRAIVQRRPELENFPLPLATDYIYHCNAPKKSHFIGICSRIVRYMNVAKFRGEAMN